MVIEARVIPAVVPDIKEVDRYVQYWTEWHVSRLHELIRTWFVSYAPHTR